MTATLVVVPSVAMARDGEDLVLDIKAVEGLKLYAKLWPGAVRCLMRQGPAASILYSQRYKPAELPFSVETLPDNMGKWSGLFDDAGVVLASGDNHLDFGIPAVTRAPTVFVIEYTLATRLRILMLEKGLSFTTLKSIAWTLGTELRRRAAFTRAAGIQANGTPAHNAYRGLSRRPMVYFDNRVTEHDMITSAELKAKINYIRDGQPLRLAFSGRLERLKGADHLISVMRHLTDKSIPFTFDVFGTGSLRKEMEAEAHALGLANRVTFHGPVPFDAQLVPTFRRAVDLFVSCHRQADPSCTYLETMACGTPIVGYDNAAFTGLLKLAPAGLATPMDNTAALALTIANLHGQRDQLASMADAAAAFARQHSFEATFERRVAQLREIAGV